MGKKPKMCNILKTADTRANWTEIGFRGAKDVHFNFTFHILLFASSAIQI